MTEILNLLIVYFNYIFLFVLHKQVKQKFGSSHSNVFREKNKSRENPRKTTVKKLFFGKIVGSRPANLRKVNFFTDIL